MREPNHGLSPAAVAKRLVAMALTGGLAVACASLEFDPAPAPEQSGTGGFSDSDERQETVGTGSNNPQRPLDQALTRQQIEELTSRASQNSVRRPAGLIPPAAEYAVPAAGIEEELWVIAKPTRDDVPPDAQTDTGPGSGALLAHVPAGRGSGAIEVPLPLEHTAVDAVINGYISTVSVRQRFGNPFSSKIEASYLFPLPEKAAVSEFLMIIGERRIRGILREKEEAKAIYQAARSQGYRASLLEQRRPNVFEQKVANIEPGKSIDVDIKYFHTLAYEDGHYSFVFPTVVGPRYNAPGTFDPIIPAARSAGAGTNAGAVVPYLGPNERSAHDLSIDVQIHAGVELERLWSSHEIVATQSSPDSASVRLANRATLPNRDFILNFEVAGETIKSNLLTYADPVTGQGYFTLMMYPPATVERLARRPMEMVFVVDCSGSMNGTPLEQAKAAVSAALGHLHPEDTFQIIRFSDDSSRFGFAPVPATTANVAKARRYLRQLSGTGSTQMIEGVRAALDFPHDDRRLRFVSFMTDGYIGNETDIIGAVHERLGASRVFSFGVGSSVNRFLLERMAKVGRGAVAYLGPQDSGADVMSAFFNRISHAALTDLEIDWGSMSVSDVYPHRLPDLFVGRPLVVTGKYLGTPSVVTVSGRVAENVRNFEVGNFDSGAENAPVAKIWARLRIADLSDRQATAGDPYGEVRSLILGTALEHQLMSQYTSFVAVDSSRRTDGEYGTTVEQALPVPDGVRYDTTVEQR